MTILIYITGVICSYFIGKLYFKKAIGEWTILFRTLTIAISIISWGAVAAFLIAYIIVLMVNSDFKDRPTKW